MGLPEGRIVQSHARRPRTLFLKASLRERLAGSRVPILRKTSILTLLFPVNYLRDFKLMLKRQKAQELLEANEG
jgi:hypothetical protein